MSLTPIIKSDNPDFNYEAAEMAYRIIMKMDLDEARLFSQMVVGEYLEDTIEKNLRTLQGHLNDVIAKRTKEIKKALLSSVSKDSGNQSVAYAQAIALIEKAWQNPYQTGAYQFKESDFRRDPHSGQFQVKVHHDPRKPALTDDQAGNLGINPAHPNYQALSPAERSQYQQEYMQISNFLNGVAAGGNLGEHDVRLQMQDMDGNRYYKPVTGKHDIDTLDPTSSRVVGIEARPTALTLGGASFGLVHALGADNARTIDRADTKFNGFSGSWQAQDYDARNTNARLYNRVAAGSKFVADVAPRGSHVQIAARLAQMVGDHGPEAEKVFGPSMRHMAYRYRGTERSPDPRVLEDYTNATRTQQARDMLESERRRDPASYLTGEQDEELKRRQSQARMGVREQRWKKAMEGTDQTIVRRGHTTTETGAERRTSNMVQLRDIRLSPKENAEINQRVREEYLKEIAPKATEATPHGVARAKAVLLQHLWDNMPNKDLYGLQLDSGNTPPSEGFIIDARGQIAAQATGYSDDHYLPFNYKNMKALKGGSYIRTRSVGGPTSEDIYTGLMSGARELTVTSRSGTYTVRFKDDFRGGRRYNDKARRMTRRYQQILDSVQSESVDRNQQISPEMRSHIAESVRRDFGPTYPRTKQRERIREREKEYKNELDMTSGEQDDFEAYFEDQAAGMGDRERNSLHHAMMNDWKANNEFQFKLNGQGYFDALQALHEQFPYYLDKPTYVLRNQKDQIHTEKDKGYVEPGRNRPTQANAGWHGTGINNGTGFVSASQTNYQRGLYGSGERNVAPPRGGAPATTPAPGTAPAAAQGDAATTPVGNGAHQIPPTTPQNQLAAIHQRQAYVPKAIEVANKIKAGLNWETSRSAAPWLDVSDDELEQVFRTPEGVQRMDNFMNTYGPGLRERGVISQADITGLRAAGGQIESVEYDRSRQLNLGPILKFPNDPAYTDEATPEQINAEINRLNSFRSVTVPKPVGEMSENELKHEIGVLRRVMDVRAVLPELGIDGQKSELAQLGATSADRLKLTDEDLFDQHAEALQRARALLPRRANQPQTAVTEVMETPGEITSRADTTDHNAREVNDLADRFDQAQMRMRTSGHIRVADDWKQIRDMLQTRGMSGELITDDELDSMKDAIGDDIANIDRLLGG